MGGRRRRGRPEEADEDPHPHRLPHPVRLAARQARGAAQDRRGAGREAEGASATSSTKAEEKNPAVAVGQDEIEKQLEAASRKKSEQIETQMTKAIGAAAGPGRRSAGATRRARCAGMAPPCPRRARSTGRRPNPGRDHAAHRPRRGPASPHRSPRDAARDAPRPPDPAATRPIAAGTST